jgi:hypothetical protein
MAMGDSPMSARANCLRWGAETELFRKYRNFALALLNGKLAVSLHRSRTTPVAGFAEMLSGH